MTDPGLPPDELAERWRRDLARPSAPRERRKVDGQMIELVGADDPVTGERMDPPDAAWDSGEARLRREAWISEREQRLHQRHAERKRLTEGERLDLALRLLATRIGGMRSRPIAAVRQGTEEPVGPPRGCVHPEAEPGEDWCQDCEEPVTWVDYVPRSTADALAEAIRKAEARLVAHLRAGPIERQNGWGASETGAILSDALTAYDEGGRDG